MNELNEYEFNCLVSSFVVNIGAKAAKLKLDLFTLADMSSRSDKVNQSCYTDNISVDWQALYHYTTRP